MNQLPLLIKKRPCSIPTNPKYFKTETDESKLPQLKNYDIAIDYYSKGIKNDRTNVYFLIKRAICYLGKGFYTLALKDALKAIEIDSKYPKGYYIASLAYLEMFDIEKAEKFITDKTKNNNPRLVYLLEKTKKDIQKKCMKFSSYSKFLYFLKVLYKHDSFFPKLEIHFYSDDNRGVIAKAPIKKNEIIMTIPKSCLISLEVAYATPLGKEIKKFMYKELNSPKHCVLSAYYLSEEKSERWKFYFDLFPKDFTIFPVFYKKKELELLEGSPFLRQIFEKRKEMKCDYDIICSHIPSFAQYSYMKFVKARLIISSRIFGVCIEGTNTDVLAPYADLLNHRSPRQTNWYYDDSLGSFVIQAIDDISEGSEIFDTYGMKTNSRFLMNYGFVIEDNETNEYPLIVTFNENFPLFETKKQFFENPNTLTKMFKLNTNIYESDLFELFSFLRFILYDGDINTLLNSFLVEKDMSYSDSDIYKGIYSSISPITKELEIQVLKYFNYLCKDALKKYPTSWEEDKMLLKSKKNISYNMKNCLILIMSEKKVLLYFINFCEYCLKLLKMNEIEIITKVNNDYNHYECQFKEYIQDVILKLIDL